MNHSHTFSLNDLETIEYNKFIKEHEKCQDVNYQIIVSFEHNGSFSRVKVKCPICGEERDITDMTWW